MKEDNYILLFDDDLITGSVLKLLIYENKPDSNIYQVSSTKAALGLLDEINNREELLEGKQEVCFFVDLNMKAFEGYQFLLSLEKHDFNCPVSVYIFNNKKSTTEHRPTQHLPIAERFTLPLDLEVVKRALKNNPSQYSKKEKNHHAPLTREGKAFSKVEAVKEKKISK